MTAIPTLFVSHGGPDIVTNGSSAGHFLRELSQHFPKPKAIVINSAHFETQGPAIVADPAPGMIYDFGGFAPELYEMDYPAPGSPGIAANVVTLLQDAGFKPSVVAKRGYDHGTWTPLKLAYPDADIPVVQVSIDAGRDAHYHYSLGRALAPLRNEGLLLMGSGHITHNLRAIFGVLRGNVVTDPGMTEKVSAFTGWFADRLETGCLEPILNWKEEAPFVSENHPTDEHLMPLFFAYGAAGEGARGQRLHSSVQNGFFAFDFYRFQ